VPEPGYQAQKEEAEGPLRHGHADDREGLSDGLEENGPDQVLDVRDVEHVLAEPIMGSYRCKDCVHQQKPLEGRPISVSSPWGTSISGRATYEGECEDMVIYTMGLDQYHACIEAKNDEHQRQDRQRPHDGYCPRSITLHTHLDSLGSSDQGVSLLAGWDGWVSTVGSSPRGSERLCICRNKRLDEVRGDGTSALFEG